VAAFPANEVAGTNLASAIKDGDQFAGLAVDSQIEAWTLTDMAAREITGQSLPLPTRRTTR
jgi:hypothetical protein